VGEVQANSVMKAEEIHAREMEHYADQEDVDEEKPDPESWILAEAESLELEEIKRMFLTFDKDGLGTTSLERHSIELVEGAKIFKDRPYPMSPAKQKVVEDEVDKMLALGVIEESKSPWSNRTTVVSKPGKDRFCLDARKLNEVTVKDAYPLPSIDRILSRIDHTHYISSVDLKFAFWQIELDEKSKELTAFTVPVGLMDTGASISCIGGRVAAEIVKTPNEYKPIHANVSTADGQKQPIVGRIKTSISFRGESKPFRLYIVPSLSQDLYLGMDFWNSFKLLPEFIVNQRQPNALVQIASLEHNDPNQLDITSQQKMLLAATIKLFPSFAEKGLGKTTLIEHEIDTGSVKPIKQRHYAVSPAIEKMMYAELDRMLSLGVVEESDGSWSSPVVLVRKPGKVRLCVDCRKLNEVTVKNAYPMPLIEGIL
ncbi:hypothetical protein KR059_005834, partial [Drosophila kikkawai]